MTQVVVYTVQHGPTYVAQYSPSGRRRWWFSPTIAAVAVLVVSGVALGIYFHRARRKDNSPGDSTQGMQMLEALSSWPLPTFEQYLAICMIWHLLLD
jgi:hypothetical protein